MKRIIGSLIGLLAAIFFLTASAHADVNSFSFNSFSGDYTLTRDAGGRGHLHVVEKLEAVFPEYDQNHGILRAIPKSYERHNVHLHVISVADGNNQPLPYSTSTDNGNLVLKIGDANQYVHGLQNYVITYDVDNVTTKAGGYDGFFWDINGDQWSQPFAQVTARIHLDPGLTAARSPGNDRCFTGTRGSHQQNCNVEVVGSVVTVRASQLAPGETLTSELGFKSGTFAAYTIPRSDIISWAVKIAVFLLLPIGLALWFAGRRWWMHGRDPKGRGTVIAEYTPPKDITPLMAGAIWHQGFQPKAITATILDLAVRGYIKIYETKQERVLRSDKTTYELELVKAPAGLTDAEQQVVSMLFGASATGSRVNISSLANKLYTQADRIGKAVNQSTTDAGFFTNNPEKARFASLAAGFVLIVAGFFLGFEPFLLAGVIAAGLITVAFGLAMPARTVKGVEAYDILKGLKLFITMTESDRIKAMQSPGGRLTEKVDAGDKKQLINVYERLLPYAMLFGLEKQWIKQFADLYEHDPSWYSGTSAFNAIYFSNAMSGFATASNAGFTAPSSSGSGGSAGGGGGGGGGGGW